MYLILKINSNIYIFFPCVCINTAVCVIVTLCVFFEVGTEVSNITSSNYFHKKHERAVLGKKNSTPFLRLSVLWLPTLKIKRKMCRPDSYTTRLTRCVRSVSETNANADTASPNTRRWIMIMRPEAPGCLAERNTCINILTRVTVLSYRCFDALWIYDALFRCTEVVNGRTEDRKEVKSNKERNDRARA